MLIGIFTGGDDVMETTLRIAHLPHMNPERQFDLDEELQIPPLMKLRPHESGLTAILPLPGSTVQLKMFYLYNEYTDLYASSSLI